MPTLATDAGGALHVIANKLEAADILTNEGATVLRDIGATVRRRGNVTDWGYRVDRNRPISFRRATDKNGKPVVPSLIADISIEQQDVRRPPFQRLDTAIEIKDLMGTPVARWHLDLANAGQEGPLTHLQFGGHNRGAREFDHPLKEPRWCHPPLEVGLLCEVVAANFFNSAWRQRLRDDDTWCRAIRTLQRLCFEAYIVQLQECLNVGHSTALTRMWADRWA